MPLGCSGATELGLERCGEREGSTSVDEGGGASVWSGLINGLSGEPACPGTGGWAKEASADMMGGTTARGNECVEVALMSVHAQEREDVDECVARKVDNDNDDATYVSIGIM